VQNSKPNPSAPTGEILKDARAVAFSWHGVLFDRDRVAIHAAMRETFAKWGVQLTDADLVATRGPTGRPQIVRLFSIPHVAEAFRARHNHWVREEDLDTMARDHEPRLLAAAASAPAPNQEACDAIRALHARGMRTAVICCTPRRLLGPQLEALAAANVPLDAIVTADEACEPAPAPWGVFEALRVLGINDAALMALVDDSPAGAVAARNAGARGIALSVAGAAASSDASATVASLSELVGR